MFPRTSARSVLEGFYVNFTLKTYVVPLLLVPVEGLLGTNCAVAWGSLLNSVGRISTTPTVSRDQLPSHAKT